MVRLMDEKDYDDWAKYSHFNSSMVRLMDFSRHDLAELLGYFNSSMVRLMVSDQLLITEADKISIPLWCD